MNRFRIFAAELVASNPDVWGRVFFHKDDKMCVMAMLCAVKHMDCVQVRKAAGRGIGLTLLNDRAKSAKDAAQAIWESADV